MSLLLAIETSGRDGSLALARVTPGQSDIEVLELVALTGGAFSAQLVPQITAVLAKGHFTKNDLIGFAVVTGPGSFTGLRVGLAAIKGLAEALQKPIAAISLLAAVASRGNPGRVLSAVDAGRGDVYIGDYEINAQQRTQMVSERMINERMISECLLSKDEFAHEVKGKNVVTPDPLLAQQAHATAIQVKQVAFPDAALIARLGWQHLELGLTVRPEELEANYIRRSDAEIFSKPAS